MFIVIEKHGGWEYATVVTDEDGDNKVFDNLEDAQEEADDCQEGIIVGDEMIDADYRPFIEEMHTIYSLLEEAEGDADSGTVGLAKERMKALINQIKEEV